MCDMTHSHVWHDHWSACHDSRFTTGGPSGIFTATQRKKQKRKKRKTSRRVCVTCNVYICDMTRWYVCHDFSFYNRRTQWRIQCTTARSVVCVWHDVFMCDMTFSHVRHNVFTCVTRLADIRRTQWKIQCHRKKERTKSRPTCVTHASIRMCDMTQWHVCRDSRFTTGGPSGISSATERKNDVKAYMFDMTHSCVTCLADTCTVTLILQHILQQADPVVYSVHDVKAIITGADRHKFSKVNSTVFLT